MFCIIYIFCIFLKFVVPLFCGTKSWLEYSWSISDSCVVPRRKYCIKLALCPSSQDADDGDLGASWHSRHSEQQNTNDEDQSDGADEANEGGDH